MAKAAAASAAARRSKRSRRQRNGKINISSNNGNNINNIWRNKYRVGAMARHRENMSKISGENQNNRQTPRISLRAASRIARSCLAAVPLCRCALAAACAAPLLPRHRALAPFCLRAPAPACASSGRSRALRAASRVHRATPHAAARSAVRAARCTRRALRARVIRHAAFATTARAAAHHGEHRRRHRGVTRRWRNVNIRSAAFAATRMAGGSGCALAGTARERKTRRDRRTLASDRIFAAFGGGWRQRALPAGGAVIKSKWRAGSKADERRKGRRENQSEMKHLLPAMPARYSQRRSALPRRGAAAAKAASAAPACVAVVYNSLTPICAYRRVVRWFSSL